MMPMEFMWSSIDWLASTFNWPKNTLLSFTYSKIYKLLSSFIYWKSR